MKSNSTLEKDLLFWSKLIFCSGKAYPSKNRYPGIVDYATAMSTHLGVYIFIFPLLANQERFLFREAFT